MKPPHWNRTAFLAVATVAASCFLALGAAHAQSPPALSSEAAELLEAFRAAPYFWQAGEIAEKIGELNDRAVIPEIAPLLESDDRLARSNAAYILAMLGDERGLPAILAEVRDMSPDRLVTERRSDWLPHPEGQIRQDRYYAVQTLARLGDKRVVADLIPYLADPDIDIAVAYALGVIGDERAITPLKNKLAQGDDRPMQTRTISAAHALMRLGEMEGLTAIEQIVADKSTEWVARRNAVYGLGEFEGDEVFDIMLSALDDPSPDVVAEAIRQLATRGDPRAIPSLEKLLPDEREMTSGTPLMRGGIWKIQEVAGVAIDALRQDQSEQPTTGNGP